MTLSKYTILLSSIILFSISISEVAFASNHNENSLLREPFWENMSFDSLESYFNEITTNLAAGSTVFDLALYVLAMFIYAVFVWHFYRFIARREIIPICPTCRNKDGKISTAKIAGYIAGHVFLFPLIIWIWFIVYSWFMFILAKDMPLGVILLVSISVIGATRMTSYYKEDLAKDVGKLLPFALLGIFLTSSAFFSETANFFSLDEIEERIEEIPLFISRIIEFVIIITAMEIILRIIFLIKRKIKPAVEEKLEEKIEEQINEKIKVKVEEIEKEQDKLEGKIEKSEDKLEEKIEKTGEKLAKNDKK
jgi:hypothetical protein